MPSKTSNVLLNQRDRGREGGVGGFSDRHSSETLRENLLKINMIKCEKPNKVYTWLG